MNLPYRYCNSKRAILLGQIPESWKCGNAQVAQDLLGIGPLRRNNDAIMKTCPYSVMFFVVSNKQMYVQICFYIYINDLLMYVHDIHCSPVSSYFVGYVP
jgi:hypothetical protein